MGRDKDAKVFNHEAAERIVRSVVDSGGPVYAKGLEQVRKEGTIEANVDPKAKRMISHNSFGAPIMHSDHGLVYVMVNGVAVPLVFGLDGTRSFARYYPTAFAGNKKLHGMLDWMKETRNPQLSTAIVQDVDDVVPDIYPPIQRAVFQSVYETDERVVSWMTKMFPSDNGHDATEDYQLFLLQLLLQNDWDWSDFYGLKPYGFLVADEVGRDTIDPKMAEKHLGISAQMLQRLVTPFRSDRWGNQEQVIETATIGRVLSQKMFFFYIRAGDVARSKGWWTNVLGPNRVVDLPSPNLVAELQASIVYALESPDINERELYKFLTEIGGNTNVSRSESNAIFSAMKEAKVPFGAQNLKGLALPRKGDLFDHPRNPWPIGHPNYLPYDKLGLETPESAIALLGRKPKTDESVVYVPEKKKNDDRPLPHDFEALDEVTLHDDDVDEAGDKPDDEDDGIDWGKL